MSCMCARALLHCIVRARWSTDRSKLRGIHDSVAPGILSGGRGPACGPPPSLERRGLSPSPPPATELSPTPITPPPGARRIPLRSSRAEVRILARRILSFFNSRIAHILASRPRSFSIPLARSSSVSLLPFRTCTCASFPMCARREHLEGSLLSLAFLWGITRRRTLVPLAPGCWAPSSEHERPKRIYGFLTIGFITSGESLVYSHLFSLAIQARTRGLRSVHRLDPRDTNFAGHEERTDPQIASSLHRRELYEFRWCCEERTTARRLRIDECDEFCHRFWFVFEWLVCDLMFLIYKQHKQ